MPASLESAYKVTESTGVFRLTMSPSATIEPDFLIHSNLMKAKLAHSFLFLLVWVSCWSHAAANDLSIRILSPGSQALVTDEIVTVQLALRLPESEQLERVILLVNGQAVAQQTKPNQDRDIVVLPNSTDSPVLLAGERKYLLSATLPSPIAAPESEVDLQARLETKSGQSAQASRTIRRRTVNSSQFVPKPRMYLLAIGVSRYRQHELDLMFPAKDATELAGVLATQQGGLYRSVQTKLLTDQMATKAAILDGLEWFQRQSTSKDVLVLFMAGHGINDPSTGRYYFLPYDAEPDAVKRTMVSQEDIQSTLSAMTGKVIVLLDSCHAGGLTAAPGLRGSMDMDAFVNELNQTEAGLLVMAASSRRQAAKESPAWGNGAFTKALLEGLGGAAAYLPGRPITVNMLDLYVSERVKQLTLGTQRAVTTKPASLGDYPIALPPVQAQPQTAPDRSERPLPSPPALPPFPLDSSTGQAAPNNPILPKQRAPLYRQWWLWSAVAGVTVGAAILIGLLATWQRAPADATRLTLVFEPTF